MLGLPPTDAPASTFPLRAGTTSNQLPDSPELQRLGELLQETYAPVEDTLPARLAELVETLARREQGRE